MYTSIILSLYNGLGPAFLNVHAIYIYLSKEYMIMPTYIHTYIQPPPPPPSPTQAWAGFI